MSSFFVSIQAHWKSKHPDMMDCKSDAVSELEAAVRREADPEDAAVSRLVHLAAARDGINGESTLYGGDVPAAVGILEAVANRLEYRLSAMQPHGGEKSGTLVKRVTGRTLSAASALLAPHSTPLWSDLEASHTVDETASSLMSAVERHATILAGVTTEQEEIIKRTREIGNGTQHKETNPFFCLIHPYTQNKI